MKIKSLIRSLPFVAKALGDKMGVKVQISGDGAWTNGDVINIPVLPEDNDKAAILARGYLDHEAGHIRFTECSHISSIPIAHNLANAIEDVRIEKLMGETFPGCKSNLSDLTAQMVQDGLMSFPESGNIPAVSAVIGWVHAKLEVEVLGRSSMQPIMDDAQEVLEEIFPSHWIPLLGDLVDEAKACSSTREVVAHAEKIIQTLKDWATNPPPPPPPQQGQDGDSGQDNPDETQQGGGSEPAQDDPQDGQDGQGGGSDDQQDGDGDDDSDAADGSGGSNDDSDGSNDQSDDTPDGSGQEDDSQVDQQGDQGKDQDPDGDGKSDGQGNDLADPQSSNLTNGAGSGNGLDQEQIAKTIEQILNASQEDCKGFDLGELLKSALGELATGEDSEGVCLPEEGTPQTGVVDVHRVRATTAALRSRLAGLVQSSRHQSSFPKKTGRKVDSRVLTRLAKKDTRVFKDQQVKTAVNTAVVVLVDRSGSMHGTRIEVALDSLLASAMAMDAIPGVSVCTAAFPGGSGGWAAQVVPLTRFGQSVRATTKHYGLNATGGTPLTEALYWAGYQLLAQKEPRKICLVLTDGEPNDPSTAKIALKRLAAEGIETMGLGIQHPGVSTLFKNHAVIQNLGDLPNSIFGMLQAELVRKRA